MSDKTEIHAKVKKLIAEELGIDESEVQPQAHLKNDLGADSLDAAEISVAIEEEFNITLKSENFERVESVLDAVTNALEVPHLTV